MSFTPFHFGPGLLLKGIAGRSFSWTAFVATQVVIDCETLYYLVRHEHPVHRTLHTTPGATLAGVATALAVLGLRVLLESQANGTSVLTDFKRPSIRSEVSGLGTLAGGLAGGASHPLLDGMMHRDIRTFRPWTEQILSSVLSESIRCTPTVSWRG